MAGSSVGNQPVFSAHAEVVPRGDDTARGITSILRARGGSSTAQELVRRGIAYSPRTRR